MIELQIRQLTVTPNARQDWTVLTVLRVDGDRVELEGDDRILDFNTPVVSLRDGRSILFEEDREEWARALSHTFRTPDITVAVIHDDNPVAEAEVEQPERESVTIHDRMHEVA